MFCYFNNPRAFKDYLRYYIGNVIVLIGPAIKEGQLKTCDPLPEFPEFDNEKQWEKCFSTEWGTEMNICVVWKRKF